MGYINRILNNCDETCILSLRSKEERLSWRQKIEIKIHLRFCKCCQNFTKQSDMIDDTMIGYFEDMEQQPPIKASDDFKARLKAQLK
jgi:hypothetical protein